MKKLNITSTLFIALTFFSVLVVQSSVAQSYYKWTDEKGVTHYGSQPPTQHLEGAQKIRVDTSSPSGKQASQVKIDEREKRLTEKASSPQNSIPGEKAGKAKSKNCEIYANNLSLMTKNQKIKEKNKEGELVLLSEEDKQKKISAAKEYLAENCQ